MGENRRDNTGSGHVWDSTLYKSWCHNCKRTALWLEKNMISPDHATAPMPHEELPKDCAGDFLEARSILSKSPRGAAALLRLTIQKLMPHLGEKGKNIDEDIAALVKKGLPVEIQQALDACRVIGNNAVHPGEIILSDSPELAAQMGELINFIVDNRISQPRKIKELYGRLPQRNLDAIVKRDASKS
jgi:hypothetical protein